MQAEHLTMVVTVALVVGLLIWVVVVALAILPLLVPLKEILVELHQMLLELVEVARVLPVQMDLAEMVEMAQLLQSQVLLLHVQVVEVELVPLLTEPLQVLVDLAVAELVVCLEWLLLAQLILAVALEVVLLLLQV